LRFPTIVVIVIGVRGIGDSKGNKKLLITDGEGEFDPNILVFCDNFKIEYEQLPKV
jgi:hypothetical protein